MVDTKKGKNISENTEVLASTELVDEQKKVEELKKKLEEVKGANAELVKNNKSLNTANKNQSDSLANIQEELKTSNEKVAELNDDIDTAGDILSGVVDASKIKLGDGSFAAFVAENVMVSNDNDNDDDDDPEQGEIGLIDESKWMIAAGSQDKHGRIEVFSTAGDRSPGVMMRVMNAKDEIVSAYYSEKVACIAKQDGTNTAVLQNKG